jgi:hypothetical protein
MGISKVVYGNETLVDLTNDTVSAEVLAAGYTATNAAGNRVIGTAKYAASPVADGNAVKSNGILYGAVDSTSTATVFTATVEGLTELYDGVTVMLHNGVVTSASGFTVNINGLGAKPCYNNMTNATRETTIFNAAYTMMFVYSTALNSGNGGWWIYRGYDANTNTIGYQLRTNSALRPAKVRGYRYRIWFTALDGKHWVPANESSSTNATTSRTPSDEDIDPFGEIVYNSTNGTVNANANIPAATAWQQYTLSLGYSFNHEGEALNLTYPAPVYVKCQPQTSGGVVMKDYTQTLPSTDDGYVYLFLGMAYNATNIELFPTHPCYHYKDGAIRLWTNAAASSTVTVDSELSASSENPVQNKVINAALEDHQEQIDEINDSIGALPYTGVGRVGSMAIGADYSAKIPESATINSTGLITFKNGVGADLFTLQLPIYSPAV